MKLVIYTKYATLNQLLNIINPVFQL